jgi:serine/threonine protein kinase
MHPQPAEPDAVRRSLERALGGQYAILRLLGRGGMGAVYLARDVALERLVAVKALPLDRGEDAASRERFRREARTAARLTHPNIVPLHGFGEADGMMYLVMGYVQGEALSARMRQGARFSVPECRRIGAEIADALDHAHGRGVVHRDVKPDNILIDDETGRALLADFGIAKARDAGSSVTQAGSLVGTPAYMSPEQAAGREGLDGRTDLYSLGVVLYTLLAGRLPFEGADAGELLAKHLTQEPAPLRKARPDAPEELTAAVMRCLAKDPDARWPDARRLREAIAPTGLDEEQLPEPLDALDGLVPKLLFPALLAALSGWTSFLSWTSGSGPGGLAPFLAVLLGGACLYQLPWALSAVALARRRGFSAATVVGALLRQPVWWPLFWYPRRFRRPWDVWERLPRPFRVFRGATTIAVASLLVLVPLIMWATIKLPQAAAERQEPTFLGLPMERLFLPAGYGLGLVLAVSSVAALASLAAGARHVLALGYEVFDRRRVASALLSGPTAQRLVWKKPEIVRALLPAPIPPGPTTVEPRTPREYMSAIGRAGGVVAEAEALVSEIERLDAELEMLGRDADSEEAARLRRRLEALGPEATDESDERRQMRRLLGEQLELVARVASRLEVARERRQDRLDALRALWRTGSAIGANTATRTSGSP